MCGRRFCEGRWLCGDSITRENLLRLLELFRLEMLVAKVDFDANIEDIGEEIVADWWEKF
jgi:hypothetical protein